MTTNDFYAIMPLIVLSGGAIILMCVIAIKRHHLSMYLLTLVIFLLAFYSTLTLPISLPYSVQPMFIIDKLSIVTSAVILLASFVIGLLSYGYFEQRESRKEEYYILLVLATLGALVLVMSRHFISLFLGLETLTVSLYGLIAYLRRREKSDEAGIKYLILAAFSSAFLLFGMALIYAQTGTMSFAGIAEHLSHTQKLSYLMLTGFGMMIVAIGFKLALVPFHMWTGDVYEGAPAPITAFVATVSKGGMMVLLLRFFMELDAYRFQTLLLIFTVIAIASMFVGNLLALMQNNVKRMLAYSSIAHLGYLLVAFIAGSENGLEAVIFYLIAYFITSIGAFGVITILSDSVRDAEKPDDYKGLFWKKPWMALVFTTMLLSLAGIPLTAGFIGKFYVVMAGVNTNLWLLVIMLAINSVIGLFYYLRVIVWMFQPAAEQSKKQALYPVYFIIGGITLAALTLCLIWIGVFPDYVMGIVAAIMN